MGKIHIEKGSVQETLIIPLYARKLCAEQFPTLYQDEYASKICESIDNRILNVIKDNARLTYKEIGEQVGISRVSVKTRMDALQEKGREPGWYAVRELFDKIPSAK